MLLEPSQVSFINMASYGVFHKKRGENFLKKKKNLQNIQIFYPKVEKGSEKATVKMGKEGKRNAAAAVSNSHSALVQIQTFTALW